MMDLPRTPHIQPTHCHWNRPKATSCYNLPITICMSMQSRLTRESGVISRGNKGLLSLLESRRVFLGAH